MAQHGKGAQEHAHIQLLRADHAHESSCCAASLQIIGTHISVAGKAGGIVVDGDDYNAIINEGIEPAHHIRMVDRVDDESLHLGGEFVNEAALLLYIVAPHAAPDDLEAVGIISFSGPLHGGQHIIEEVDADGGDKHADNRTFLAGS